MQPSYASLQKEKEKKNKKEEVEEERRKLREGSCAVKAQGKIDLGEMLQRKI